MVACSTGADRTPTVTVRDSAGVELMEFPGALRDQLPQWRLALELDLGSAGGALEDQFFRVTDVRVDRQGRIAVLNSGTGEVRFFSATGEFESSFGRMARASFRDRSGSFHWTTIRSSSSTWGSVVSP
jgi:hypothetical protein